MPVYQDNNGWYFVVQWTDNFKEKHRHKERCTSKKEAQFREAEYRIKLNQLNGISSTSITISELADHFFNEQKQKVQATSFSDTLGTFNHHIRPVFGHIVAKNITPDMYIRFKKEMLEKGLSHSTLQRTHIYFGAILQFGVKFYGIEKNIVRLVGGYSKPKTYDEEKEEKINFWDEEEWNQFASVIKDFNHFVLFNTLYYTGMRRGECLALTWNHIDFNNNVIKVRRSVNFKVLDDNDKDGANYHFSNTKTKTSKRDIAMTNHLSHILKMYKDQSMNIVGYSDDRFVFGFERPYSPSSVDRWKNTYCKLSNVKQIRIHDFRHSHASWLINHSENSGSTMLLISQRLGHADINETLKTYTHLLPKQHDKLIELLNKTNSPVYISE